MPVMSRGTGDKSVGCLFIATIYNSFGSWTELKRAVLQTLILKIRLSRVFFKVVYALAINLNLKSLFINQRKRVLLKFLPLLDRLLSFYYFVYFLREVELQA